MHVFVDESERGGLYLLCASLVDPAEVASVRRYMRSLTLPGERRLHAVKENTRRRKIIFTRILETGVRAVVYTSAAQPSTLARSICLRALTVDMARLGASRIVIEVVGGLVASDTRVITAARRTAGAAGQLRFDHARAFEEPLLWISDCVAWAFGKDPTWRKVVEPLIDKVVTLDP